MLGTDKALVSRCWDLKGSLLGRNTKIEKGDVNTGLKVLKDQNFKNDNEKSKIIDLEEKEKDKINEILKKDSLLLRKHELIDYSVFLIEIDRFK